MRQSWAKEIFPMPLETPDQNYWLGFLMADGNVAGYEGNGYNLRCDLASKDGYHVSRLAKFLGVRSYSYRRVVRCQIACTLDREWLAQHGLVPRKTGRETYPDSVTNHSAFISGVIDGDGSFCIATGRGGYKFVSIQISSQSRDFLWKISRRLHKELGIYSAPLLRKAKNCSQLSYSLGPKNAGRLHTFLYSSGHTYLHRKEQVLRRFAQGNSALISENRSDKDNQQGSPSDPSEITCRAPVLTG